MTAVVRALPRPWAGGGVRILGPNDEPELRALIAADPVAHCFAESRLDAAGLGAGVLAGPFYGVEHPDGTLAGAILVGANLVPIATTAASRAAFARFLIRQGRRSSSIVGPADEALDLWRLLQPAWGPARDVRGNQLVMVATDPPGVAADPAVRVSVPGDLPALFPACVAMFTEEVGISPVAGGMAGAYRSRIAELIRQGRSFAAYDDRGPVFKAELGAVSRRACQVQGVWVRPELRRRGHAARGMAAVVRLAGAVAPVVSLYVNDFNTAAVTAYHHAGFRTVGRFATVLF